MHKFRFNNSLNRWEMSINDEIILTWDSDLDQEEIKFWQSYTQKENVKRKIRDSGSDARI